MGDDSVQVSPDTLLTWGPATMGEVTGGQAGLSTAYGGISENALTAFNTPGSKTYPFREGTTVFNIMNRNMAEFKAFVADVAAGAQAISSAAVTMAVAYATTDGAAASDLSAVDFAFADGGKVPDGFPVDQHGHATTLGDIAAAQAAAAGQDTAAGMAAVDPRMLQTATSAVWVGDGYVYTFADGSILRTTGSATSSTFISGTSSSVSVFRKGETKPVTVITDSESYDYAGQRTTSTTRQSTAPDGSTITSVESTTHMQDGSIQVTTTTTGADGKTTTNSVNVKPEPPTQSADAGEIDKLETKYHSTGAGGTSWR